MTTESVNLSVVIVNFRTPNLVIDCLITLFPELENIDARIVIVDNNSGDGSYERIQEWIAQNDTNGVIVLIQSGRNSGFSAGNNIGIKTLKAQHYLLLNSDTLVRPGAIKILLKTAGTSLNAGLISPRLEGPNQLVQENCFRFPSPITEFLGAAQTGLIDRILARYAFFPPVRSTPTNPPWTGFACVLIKREVFNQVGLLDEKFFMYFEDVEFCHRARASGWEIVNIPEAHVVHLESSSSFVKGNVNEKKRLPRYFFESRTLIFYKIYGWFGLTIANLLWETGRLLSKARQLLGRSDKAVVENQWLDIWTNWLAPQKPYTHPDSGK